MQRWSFGVNAYFNAGSVFVETLPWYVGLIDWLFDHWLSHDLIPSIPFPNWFPKARGKDTPNELFTLAEWYGDLSQWWCGHVDMPIFNWVQKHPKRKEYTIELTYDTVKQIFYAYDSAYFDRLDKDVIENKKQEEEEQKQEALVKEKNSGQGS